MAIDKFYHSNLYILLSAYLSVLYKVIILILNFLMRVVPDKLNWSFNAYFNVAY